MKLKPLLATLSLATLAACTANAGPVYINEILNNSPGTDAPYEYFELRGTPGMSLAGYYLLEVEGNFSTTARGDIGQFFDLGAFSIGANGFFIAFQKGATYGPTVPGATVVTNAGSTAGWGTTGTNTVGHSSDGTQTDLENSTTTLLLINRGAGAAPLLTDDLDTNEDGILDLPSGWVNVDSVGLIDGSTPNSASFSYGAITFRVGGAAAGGSAYGNIIDVAATGSSMYAGRKGDSTGSTASDWVGSLLDGTGPAFSFLTASDSSYNGKPISDMQFGGTNLVVPEPTTIGMSVICLLSLWLVKPQR